MNSARGRVAVLGAGSWGTAVANVFADAGAEVCLWGRDEAVVASIQSKYLNPKYLKNLPLNPALKASTDLTKTIHDADIIACSIPTQQIRAVLSAHAKALNSKIVVNTSKGIEQKTHALVSEIIKSIAPQAVYAILSGPSFAEETVKRLPTAVTVASQDPECATAIQHLLVTPYFRAYTSTDVVGVELAGSLKNVVAIASGVVSGLGLGYNAQAALINRGIAEIIRIGKIRGANALTFLGLAGMGDLILTCTGPLSRNRRLGEALGSGKDLETARKELGGVAEGYFTAQSAYELGKALKVDIPITTEVYRVLYEKRSAKEALTSLMGRDLKGEWD